MESEFPRYKVVNIFPVFVALAVLSVSLISYGVADFAINSANSSSASVLGASTALYTATLAVDDSNTVKTYKGVTFESGATAYDLLVNAKEQTSFDFEGELYDFGYYIHTINGRRSLNNEYWKFVVNGEDSTVAIEDYAVEDGDKIEFVLEKF